MWERTLSAGVRRVNGGGGSNLPEEGGRGGGDTKEAIRLKATCPIKATTGELGAWGREREMGGGGMKI
jgi:hypothetical protein